MRVVASVVAAVVLAFAVGWFLGASGKSTIELQRRQQEERADLTEARALVLEGRMAIAQLNFGEAAKRFDAARLLVERVQLRLREISQAERAGQLEIALAHLKDAGRLAVALDPNAQTAADQAVQVITSQSSLSLRR